jgi:hypothetical protein
VVNGDAGLKRPVELDQRRQIYTGLGGCQARVKACWRCSVNARQGSFEM